MMTFKGILILDSNPNLKSSLKYVDDTKQAGLPNAYHDFVFS